jgi:putative Holliday junction resolvase
MAWFVGLDVGTKTIGVARADAEVPVAQPWTTIRRTGVKADCDRLLALFADAYPQVVVVGLPLSLDGEENRSTKLARQIGAALVEQGLSVVYEDERFTTVEASRRLHEAGVDSRHQRSIIDAAAATVILQDWIDSRPDP